MGFPLRSGVAGCVCGHCSVLESCTPHTSVRFLERGHIFDVHGLRRAFFFCVRLVHKHCVPWRPSLA